MNSNLKAFLDTIAYSEGTLEYGDQDGYNVLVGGGLFTDYSEHPRKLVKIRENLASTAAGRYQLLSRYYDAYKNLLGLADFSPASQDAIATQQIKECGALSDVQMGRFDDAVAKCAHIWASFPGAGYHQHENDLYKLREYYKSAGGWLA